jgi:aryl-alcohol dehydrogenase-like predicted oxidoreductase
VKFALGTAQFGLVYGIANRDGQVPLSEVQQILQTARSVGVDFLDTAADYGESESCLGKLGVDTFNVVTKLPAQIDKSKSIEEWVETCVHASLRRLNVSSVYGLLLHRSNQLLTKSGKDLINVINNLKASGLIKKFGVSIYDPSELDAVTQISIPDIVQAPLNVFDRRLITSGWLQQLHDRGVEVHTRSAFLQGLLLLPKSEVPKKFTSWSELFDRWFEWLDENSNDPITACLAAVFDHRISCTVVGVDSSRHLEQISTISQKINNQACLNLDCDDLNLIDPSNWSKL